MTKRSLIRDLTEGEIFFDVDDDICMFDSYNEETHCSDGWHYDITSGIWSSLDGYWPETETGVREQDMFHDLVTTAPAPIACWPLSINKK